LSIPAEHARSGEKDRCAVGIFRPLPEKAIVEYQRGVIVVSSPRLTGVFNPQFARDLGGETVERLLRPLRILSFRLQAGQNQPQSGGAVGSKFPLTLEDENSGFFAVLVGGGFENLKSRFVKSSPGLGRREGGSRGS
jgi:hypothetical protein